MFGSSATPTIIDVPAQEDGRSHVEVRWPAKRRRVSWYGLAYLGLIAVALMMRLWDLDSKALHHDESLHAVYSWYLFEGRGYRHDPMMHGPFQFFGTAGIFTLFGDNSYTARVLPALFGAFLVGIPWLLRGFLGRSGALVTAVLLAFSPAMLYYSRFARGDIYMAVWTLLLVTFMWRYMATRQRRFLVGASAVLALMFSTKETAYLVVAVIGSFLFIYAITDIVPWVFGRKSLRDFSPAGEFLILMAALTLPLGSAAIALFQGPLGITLANGDWQRAAVGIPLGSGLYVAFFFGLAMILGAVVLGLRWRPRVWLLCFGTFYGIWVLLYTSFFTNWIGLGSGLWQALGYWIAQQDVARGGQPWYYYFVIGLNYEFLPLVFGAIAAVFYALKGNAFTRFLAFWAVGNFLVMTYASEKMPWLLVGVALPFIVLTGKFLGDLLDRRPWRSVAAATGDIGQATLPQAAVSWRPVELSVLVGLLVVAAAILVVLAVLPESSGAQLAMLGIGLLTAGFAGVLIAARQVPGEKRGAVVGLAIAAVMLVAGVPGAVRAAYANADIPVEMLVYTQSSPDIPQIMKNIDRLAEETGKGKDLAVLVDSSDGYSWPWAWYLRDYRLVYHQCLTTDSGCSRLTSPPTADVALVNARSTTGLELVMAAYGEPLRYRHRWWFPESYRGVTPGKIVDGLTSREAWCNVVAYFVNRDLGQGLGSTDAYAYFPKDFTPTPVSTDLGERLIQCS